MAFLASLFTQGLAAVKLAALISSAQIGPGTTFWANGDPSNPDPRNACHLRVKGIPKRLDDRAMAFAHKTLPCGSWAIIYNPRTGRSVLAQKWDWGPRHALIDMTRAVTKAIGSDGEETVVVFPIK